MRQVMCPTCGIPTNVISDPAGPIWCEKCHRITFPSITEEQSFPAPVRYPVRPYVLRSRGNPKELARVAGFSLMAAIFLAGVCHLIRQSIWFMPVFEMMHGAGIGYAVAYAARVRKVRYLTPIGVIAGIAGFLSAAWIHLFDYLVFAGPGVSFLDFMHKQATIGEWIIALSATSAFAVVCARTEVSRPFCEQCENWKPKQIIGPVQLNPKVAVEAIALGTPAVALVPGDKTCKFHLEIYSCPNCRQTGDIEVRASGSWKEDRKQFGGRCDCTYPAEAWIEFCRIEQTCKDEGLEIKG